jgi:hypothetical protein
MNRKRVAALLRELADAIEQEEPKRSPRRRSVVAPPAEVSPQAEERARRALKKHGVAA